MTLKSFAGRRLWKKEKQQIRKPFRKTYRMSQNVLWYLIFGVRIGSRMIFLLLFFEK